MKKNECYIGQIVENIFGELGRVVSLRENEAVYNIIETGEMKKNEYRHLVETAIQTDKLDDSPNAGEIGPHSPLKVETAVKAFRQFRETSLGTGANDFETSIDGLLRKEEPEGDPTNHVVDVWQIRKPAVIKNIQFKKGQVFKTSRVGAGYEIIRLGHETPLVYKQEDWVTLESVSKQIRTLPRDEWLILFDVWGYTQDYRHYKDRVFYLVKHHAAQIPARWKKSPGILYRGLQLPMSALDRIMKKGSFHLAPRSISSWSSAKEISESFANNKKLDTKSVGIVYQKKVPNDHVLLSIDDVLKEFFSDEEYAALSEYGFEQEYLVDQRGSDLTQINKKDIISVYKRNLKTNLTEDIYNAQLYGASPASTGTGAQVSAQMQNWSSTMMDSKNFDKWLKNPSTLETYKKRYGDFAQRKLDTLKKRYLANELNDDEALMPPFGKPPQT